jgi:hypothetical protein
MYADLPIVKRIWAADVCRDGGSYLFCFDSDDGNWYEFFLKTTAFDPTAIASHEAPAIYRESSNDGQLVRNLSWADGKQFVSQLKYDDARFQELLEVVATEGRSK